MTTRLRRLAALLLVLTLTLSATAFAAEDQRTAQRREDLDVLCSTLIEKHPDLFHRTPESAFLQKKAEIEAGLPEMDDLTFAFALQSLVSLAGLPHHAELGPLRVPSLSCGHLPAGGGLGAHRPAGGGKSLYRLDGGAGQRHEHDHSGGASGQRLQL